MMGLLLKQMQCNATISDEVIIVDFKSESFYAKTRNVKTAEEKSLPDQYLIVLRKCLVVILTLRLSLL